MFVPLGEMLKADVFRGAELVTERLGMERIVTSINVVDGAKGYDYAGKDMFVLCSAYSIAKTSKQQVEFIEQMAERGVIAVALKPEHFKDGIIPHVLKARAETLGLSLIALPNISVSYADFFNFFASNIFCRGTSEFISKDTLLKTLIENMSYKGLPWLVEYLHFISGNNISVLFNDIHYTFPENDKSTDFALFLSKYSSARNVIPSPKFPGMSAFVGKELVGKEKEGCLLHALGVSFNFDLNTVGEIWFYKEDTEMNSNDAVMLDCSKLACELEINQLLIYHQQQACIKYRFIEHLLTGQVQTLHESMLYAKALNWRLPMELRIFVIDCSTASSMLQEMELVVNNILEKQRMRIVVYPHNGQLVILLPIHDETGIRLCDAILTELQHKFPKHRFSGGLGREVQLQNIRLGYEQAVYSLQIGATIFPERSIHDFKKLGLFRLYCPFALPQEIEAFCSDYLGTLIRVDAETKLDLLKTLKAYFDYGENFSRTGNELFLHPNTIRYRIETIEKMCDVDFSNPDDTLNIKIALQLLPLLPKLPRLKSRASSKNEDPKNEQ